MLDNTFDIKIAIEDCLSKLEPGRQKYIQNVYDKLDNKKKITTHESEQLEKFETDCRDKHTNRRTVKTLKEVARHLGRGVRSVSDYKKNSGLPQNSDGTYDLDDLDKWWLGHEGQKALSFQGMDGDIVNSDKSTWEIRLIMAKTRTAEINLEEKLGALISKEDVELQRVARITETKAALTGLERKLPPLLEGHDKRTMEKILHTEIEDLLNRFARQYGGDIR